MELLIVVLTLFAGCGVSPADAEGLGERIASTETLLDEKRESLTPSQVLLAEKYIESLKADLAGDDRKQIELLDAVYDLYIEDRTRGDNKMGILRSLFAVDYSDIQTWIVEIVRDSEQLTWDEKLAQFEIQALLSQNEKARDTILALMGEHGDMEDVIAKARQFVQEFPEQIRYRVALVRLLMRKQLDLIYEAHKDRGLSTENPENVDYDIIPHEQTKNALEEARTAVKIEPKCFDQLFTIVRNALHDDLAGCDEVADFFEFSIGQMQQSGLYDADAIRSMQETTCSVLDRHCSPEDQKWPKNYGVLPWDLSMIRPRVTRDEVTLDKHRRSLSEAQVQLAEKFIEAEKALLDGEVLKQVELLEELYRRSIKEQAESGNGLTTLWQVFHVDYTGIPTIIAGVGEYSREWTWDERMACLEKQARRSQDERIREAILSHMIGHDDFEDVIAKARQFAQEYPEGTRFPVWIVRRISDKKRALEEARTAVRANPRCFEQLFDIFRNDLAAERAGCDEVADFFMFGMGQVKQSGLYRETFINYMQRKIDWALEMYCSPARALGVYDYDLTPSVAEAAHNRIVSKQKTLDEHKDSLSQAQVQLVEKYIEAEKAALAGEDLKQIELLDEVYRLSVKEHAQGGNDQKTTLWEVFQDDYSGVPLRIAGIVKNCEDLTWDEKMAYVEKQAQRSQDYRIRDDILDLIGERGDIQDVMAKDREFIKEFPEHAHYRVELVELLLRYQRNLIVQAHIDSGISKEEFFSVPEKYADYDIIPHEQTHKALEEARAAVMINPRYFEQLFGIFRNGLQDKLAHCDEVAEFFEFGMDQMKQSELFKEDDIQIMQKKIDGALEKYCATVGVEGTSNSATTTLP